MTVRFGIIGLGTIANRFAAVLDTADGAELEAVASRDIKKSKEFAQKYSVKKAYDVYDDLIQDKEVDIIYVALTHNFHFEIVKKCLNHNKAVLCEKPMTINGRDAEELVELSRKNNTLLMEAMWTRCIPAFQKAKEWVKSGLIGNVSLVDASFAFNIPYRPDHRLFNPELAGGSLYDAGVYPIEFAIGILDEIPSSIKGVASICPSGVDDFVSMSFGFKSGAVATLSCGLKAKTNRDATIYGTRGHIVVYDFLGSKKCERYDEKGELLETFEESFEDGFIYEIFHVCDLFKNKKIESDLIPHRDTLACSKIFDELMAQIHRG
jgi:predicted dehydrogenase